MIYSLDILQNNIINKKQTILIQIIQNNNRININQCIHLPQFTCKFYETNGGKDLNLLVSNSLAPSKNI